MGDTIGVWEDELLDTPFSVKYPKLYTNVQSQTMSLKECLVENNLLDLFRLPMSRVAYNEFLLFQVDLEFFKELR